MHHTLYIDEILNVIFSDPILHEVAEDRSANHASSSDDRIFRRYPLLSLALTCRSFYESATRVLWRRIIGLDQLLRSMSHDVVQKIGSPKFTVFRPMRECMFLKRVPSEQDWAHFEHLAAYVQEFDNRESLTLGHGVLQVLRDRYGNRKIFPFLRVLSCRGCVRLQCVNFLLHPELHTLRISLFPGGCDFCPLVSSEEERRLPILSCLNHIQFIVPTTCAVTYERISTFLLAHATINLRSVYIWGMPVPSEVVKAILQCEALEKIALRATSFDIDDLFAINMPRPNLRCFHMESREPAEGTEVGGWLAEVFFTKLMEKLRAPNLIEFKFSSLFDPYASDIKGLLETMLGRERSDENHAESIELMLHRPNLTDLPTDAQPHICTFANALHALASPLIRDSTRSCPSKLKVLNLVETYVDLSDNELGILAASLPHLKSLTFSIFATYDADQAESRTTLTGLWLLAKHCKNLEELGMLIDAKIDWEAFGTLTGFDGDHNNIGARLKHYALATNVNVRTLTLGDSTVGEESVALEFLGKVFPKILNLYYARYVDETDAMVKWRAIKYGLTRTILD